MRGDAGDDREIDAMAKLTLRDLDVQGKRVLVRVDFNVPTEQRDGKIVITDDNSQRDFQSFDQALLAKMPANMFPFAQAAGQPNILRRSRPGRSGRQAPNSSTSHCGDFSHQFRAINDFFDLCRADTITGCLDHFIATTDKIKKACFIHANRIS